MDRNPAETQPTRLAAGTHKRLEDSREHLADGEQLDGEVSQVRSDVPDVAEGEAGEVAAPAERAGDAADEGEDLVTDVESAVEALVAAAPHAVGRADPFRLPQHVLELHLVRGIMGTYHGFHNTSTQKLRNKNLV